MNYYEIKYLKDFIKSKIVGKEIIIANTRYKNLIEFFLVGDSEKNKLVFSTSPGNIALFWDDHSNPKRKNTISFFEKIYGLVIRDVSIAESDRILNIHIEDGYELVFKIFGNNSNVILTKDGHVTKSFKGGGISEIETPKAKSIQLFDTSALEGTAKDKITTLNPLIPRSHLDLIIKQHGLEHQDDKDLIVFVENITKEIQAEPQWRLLKDGSTTLFNKKIVELETEKTFDSINDLVSYRYKNYAHSQRLKQQKSEWTKQVKRQIKRTESSLRNLNKADEGVERSKKYEKYGHLLMANGHKNPVSATEITVLDLYDGGKEIRIPLDGKLSVIENAEKYYHKSKSSLQSYDEALERIPILERKKEALEKMSSELSEITRLRDLNDWEKANSKQLAEFHFGEKNSASEIILPFYTLQIDDYPVWIGKNAKSNDVLVQMAHKEDVWLHARGVSGSHTLIRMGNTKEMPPKPVLMEAASYAAYNSKAKGSQIVPVIITKKKYVRKPKGAAAGAVLVDKEQVEFVTPKKPIL